MAANKSPFSEKIEDSVEIIPEIALLLINILFLVIVLSITL